MRCCGVDGECLQSSATGALHSSPAASARSGQEVLSPPRAVPDGGAAYCQIASDTCSIRSKLASLVVYSVVHMCVWLGCRQVTGT